MSEPIPVIFEEGVFKPLKKIDLPQKQQLFILVGRSKEDVVKGLFIEPDAKNSAAQKVHGLIDELKTDLGHLTTSDFQFDAEHQKMFSDNASAFAPLIPSQMSC